MTEQHRQRVRRTLLITPGHRGERMAKATTLPADSLVFDLEDGVAPDHKEAARDSIAGALRAVDPSRHERVVRINAVGSEAFVADMAWLPANLLDAVMVPKVEDAAQVERLDRHATDVESDGVALPRDRQFKALEDFLEADRPADVGTERESDVTGDLGHSASPHS